MKFILIAASLLLLQSMAVQSQPNDGSSTDKATDKTADKAGFIWYNPQKKPFRLAGFQWIDQDQVYRRLPSQPQRDGDADFAIRQAVSDLADNTSGGQIHFQSNSSRVFIRATLSQPSFMYHMPVTGQSSFDLYTGAPEQLIYVKTARFEPKDTEFTAKLFSDNTAVDNLKMRNFVINFPLYNGVKSLEIGIDATATLQAPPKYQDQGVVVVYGTSITQGCCAARPGLSYTNILSRRFNREFVNLGFSGNGKGEVELAHLINQIDDKKLIILDYEANAYESIRQSLNPFIDILRDKNPLTPILIISKTLFAGEIRHHQNRQSLTARADYQRQLVQSRKLAGDANIYFVDGSTLLGNHADEATVDGTHLTSYGFMMMADTLQPVIEKILNSVALNTEL